MDWISNLDAIGIIVFAISGVLTAIDKGFDVVGAAIIGFVTAFGGGTLRDMMIGETPVGWMENGNDILLVLIAIVAAFLFQGRIMKFKKGMFIFDTIGIGMFTILGVQKTLGIGLDIPVALMMGVVSAVFGGVVRDVLCNEIPLIFRREIYASTCLAGGMAFIGLEKITANTEMNMIISIFIVFVIRYFAVRYKWSLSLKEKT